MKSTLYELTADYLQLLEMAEDPDIDPQAIEDTLEGLGGEIEDKAENYAKVMVELDAEAEKLKSEIDRLTKRKKSIESTKDRMKKSLQDSMEVIGKTKFKTELFSFSIQNNPASLVITGDKLPKKYLIEQEPLPNKQMIKDELKAGKELSFAHLEQTRSLRIR